MDISVCSMRGRACPTAGHWRHHDAFGQAVVPEAERIHELETNRFVAGRALSNPATFSSQRDLSLSEFPENREKAGDYVQDFRMIGRFGRTPIQRSWAACPANCLIIQLPAGPGGVSVW